MRPNEVAGAMPKLNSTPAISKALYKWLICVAASFFIGNSLDCNSRVNFHPHAKEKATDAVLIPRLPIALTKKECRDFHRGTSLLKRNFETA